MANLRYLDKHNMVAFLKKPTESVGFTEIVDFLKGTSLRIQELVASVDNKEYTITEASIRREHVPLLPVMLAGVAEDQGEGSAIPAEPHHTPIDSIPSTSQPSIPSTTEPPYLSPPRLIDRQNTEVPQPQGPTITFVADEATTISVGVETKGAATTTSGLDAGMDSGNIHESPLRSHEAPLPEGNTLGSAGDSLQLKELMAIVPKMVTKIDSLEKELKETKQTLRHAVLTLVKKGRKIQDIDDDPLVSLVRNSMEEKEADFVTPKKVSALGQNVSTYNRKARSASMDFFSAAKERLNSTKVKVNTKVNPGSTGVNTVKSQREGKAPMTLEDVQATQKTKEQIRQEEASIAEAIRLQALQDKEDARQVHLDALLAKRIKRSENYLNNNKKEKLKFKKQHSSIQKRIGTPLEPSLKQMQN
ncbi:hypothetical protein Tco_0114860 [Tanacetum coccineum]